MGTLDTPGTYRYNDWHFYALSYRWSLAPVVPRPARCVRAWDQPVVGEMNNFRTGTQLRARTSRVPSSRSTGHARTHAHAGAQARTDDAVARPRPPSLPPFAIPSSPRALARSLLLGRSTILVSFIFHCGQLFRAPAGGAHRVSDKFEPRVRSHRSR